MHRAAFDEDGRSALESRVSMNSSRNRAIRRTKVVALSRCHRPLIGQSGYLWPFESKASRRAGQCHHSDDKQTPQTVLYGYTGDAEPVCNADSALPHREDTQAATQEVLEHPRPDFQAQRACGRSDAHDEKKLRGIEPTLQLMTADNVRLRSGSFSCCALRKRFSNLRAVDLVCVAESFVEEWPKKSVGATPADPIGGAFGIAKIGSSTGRPDLKSSDIGRGLRADFEARNRLLINV